MTVKELRDKLQWLPNEWEARAMGNCEAELVIRDEDINTQYVDIC